MHQRWGLEGWGHSIKQLLASLPPQASVPAAVHEAGLLLDRFYIPTRYPNGFAQGVPGEYFLDRDAEEAIGHAERILEFVRGRLGL
ncbi:MAG: HEPN domain-containing protein [Thiobacillaceae bacterium]